MVRPRRSKEDRVKDFLHEAASVEDNAFFTQLHAEMQAALDTFDPYRPSSMSSVSILINGHMNKKLPGVADFLLTVGAKSPIHVAGEVTKLGMDVAMITVGTTRGIDGGKGNMLPGINAMEQKFKNFSKSTKSKNVLTNHSVIAHADFLKARGALYLSAEQKSDVLLDRLQKIGDLLRPSDSPLLGVPALPIGAPDALPKAILRRRAQAVAAPIPAPIPAPILAPIVDAAQNAQLAQAALPHPPPQPPVKRATQPNLVAKDTGMMAPPQTTVAVAGAAVVQLPKVAVTAPVRGHAHGIPMNGNGGVIGASNQVDVPKVQEAPSPRPVHRPVPIARVDMDSSDGEDMMLDGPNTFQNPDRESGSGSASDMDMEEARGLGTMFARLLGKKKKDAKRAPVYTMLQSQEVMVDLEKNQNTVPTPGSTRFLELRQRTGLRGDALVELINTVHRSMTGVAVHPPTPIRPTSPVQLADPPMRPVAKNGSNATQMHPEEHKVRPARTPAEIAREAVEKTKAVRALFLSLFSKTDKADVPKITLMQSQYMLFDFDINKSVPEAGSNRMKALESSTDLPVEVIAKCMKGMMDEYEARVAHPAPMPAPMPVPMPAPMPAPLPAPMPVQIPGLKRAAHALKRTIEFVGGHPVDVKKQKIDSGRPMISRKRSRDSDSDGEDGSKKRKIDAHGADNEDME